MKNKIVGTLVLLSALVLFDETFRPEIEVTEEEVEIVIPSFQEAQVIKSIKTRHQFEVCRDELYTKYPHNMGSKQWRDCMSRD